MSDPHQVSYFFLWCGRPESLCFWGFFVSRGPPPSPPPCFTCVCPCGVTLEAIDGLGWLWHASLVGTGPLYTNHCHVDQHDVSDRLCLTVFPEVPLEVVEASGWMDQLCGIEILASTGQLFRKKCVWPLWTVCLQPSVLRDGDRANSWC